MVDRPAGNDPWEMKPGQQYIDGEVSQSPTAAPDSQVDGGVQGNDRLDENQPRRHRTLVASGLAVALVAGGGAGYYFFNKDGESNDGKAFAASDASPSPTASSSSADCDPRFAITPIKRNNRFFENGLKGSPAAALEQVSQQAYHDVPTLDAFGSYFKNKDVDEKTLVNADGTCLTPAGQELAIQVDGFLDAAKAKAHVGVAPADGINTAPSGGRAVEAARAGISGDRKAVISETIDGRTIIIMYRCGNLVLKKTIFPEGPTDEPEEPIAPKTAQPVPGSIPGAPGSGGSPEEGMDPENDSDTTGYGPGDTVPTASPRPATSPSPSNTQPSPQGSPGSSGNPQTGPTTNPSQTSEPKPAPSTTPKNDETPPPPDN